MFNLENMTAQDLDVINDIFEHGGKYKIIKQESDKDDKDKGGKDD